MVDICGTYKQEPFKSWAWEIWRKGLTTLNSFCVFHTSQVISQPSLYNFIASYDTCSKPLPKTLNNPKLTMHLKQEESDVQYFHKQILVE
jgi:hypothetical protein